MVKEFEEQIVVQYCSQDCILNIQGKNQEMNGQYFLKIRNQLNKID